MRVMCNREGRRETDRPPEAQYVATGSHMRQKAASDVEWKARRVEFNMFEGEAGQCACSRDNVRRYEEVRCDEPNVCNGKCTRENGRLYGRGVENECSYAGTHAHEECFDTTRGQTRAQDRRDNSEVCSSGTYELAHEIDILHRR